MHVVGEEDHQTRINRCLVRLGDDGDAALAAGIAVGLGDRVLMLAVAGQGLDVVDEDLVVQHHLVLQKRHVLQAEHGEAVALVLQHVVVRSKPVGLVQIQRLVLARLLVQNLHVLHAVGLARRADPHLALVEGHVGLQIGVDLIGQTRNLKEAAVLARAHPRAHLQSVQDLLAADLHQAGCVAVGVHAQDLPVGDVASRDVRTHAAAVHKRNVSVQHVQIRVRAQVAQVRLCAAHRAVPRLGILRGQVVRRVGHNLLQQRLILRLDAGNVRRRIRVVLHLLGRGQQLDLQAAVLQEAQLADVGELRTRLSVQNRLAVLVDELAVDRAVAVAVDHSVHAAHMRDHLGSRPGRGLLVDAQVTHQDHVVRAFSSGRVDRGLGRGVQALAGGVLAEAVNVLARLVLEVDRRGLGQRLGRANAHDGHLLAVRLKDLVGVQHGSGGLAVHVVHEVRRHVGIVGFLHVREEARHGVVELVVAGHRHVIAHEVHDVDDVSAFAQGADGAALHVVARVNQNDRVALGLQALLQIGKARVAPAVLDAAVHIVGEEDHQTRINRRLGLLGSDPAGDLLGLGVAQLQAVEDAHGAGEVDDVTHGQGGIRNRLEDRHAVAGLVLDGGVVPFDGGDRQLLDGHIAAHVRLGKLAQRGGLGHKGHALGLLNSGAAQLRQALIGGAGAGADQRVAQRDGGIRRSEVQADGARLVLHIDVLAVHQGDDALDGELAAGSSQHVTDGGNGHSRGLGGLRLVGGGGRLGGIRGLAVGVQLPQGGGADRVGCIGDFVAAPVGRVKLNRNAQVPLVAAGVGGLEASHIGVVGPGRGRAVDADALVVVDQIDAAVGPGDGVGAVLLGRDRPAVVGRAAKRQRAAVRCDDRCRGGAVCHRRRR